MLLLAITALSSYGIQLVDEDDSGLLLPCCCKELADTFSANTNEDFFKLRSRGEKEGLL